MPMKPHKRESKEDFLSRCISEEIGSGYEQAQAVAMCNAMWRNRKKDSSDLEVKQV